MFEIFTFGYGNRRTHDEFLAYLREYQIRYVVDVRLSSKAWSRIWWGDQIKKVCEANGFEYLSRPQLGNTSGKAEWIPPSVHVAIDSLEGMDFLLDVGSVLFLCAELDHKRCHRTEVANQLSEMSGAGVKHLL